LKVVREAFEKGKEDEIPKAIEMPNGRGGSTSSYHYIKQVEAERKGAARKL
jgi:hypothetical protein